MKILVPADTLIEMDNFPYKVGFPWFYGCDPTDPKCKELLDSILYTIDDPDAPDYMSYVMDIDGITKWYDQVADEEERKQYNCPTVYDYLACEIGRFVTPLKGVTKQ